MDKQPYVEAPTHNPDYRIRFTTSDDALDIVYVDLRKVLNAETLETEPVSDPDWADATLDFQGDLTPGTNNTLPEEFLRDVWRVWWSGGVQTLIEMHVDKYGLEDPDPMGCGIRSV